MRRFVTVIAVGLGAFAVSAAHADEVKTAADHDLMFGAPPPVEKRVTAENFILPPYNRWSFQRMREFFPTRAVAPSTSPWILPSRPVDIGAVKVELGDRSTTVSHWLASAYTDGFIVLDKGSIAHEQYFNGQSASTPHIMFSVTKSLTGTLMLQLFEEGKVVAGETVATYVPELADTAYGDATVQQVMDMTNSIAYDETYDDPQSDIARFLAAFYPGGKGVYANLQSLTNQTPRFEHGEAFHYVTPDPEVLGWIIRRITGTDLATALHERIWSKIGTEYPADYWLDSQGVEMAGGGISTTLRDAARFGQMVLDDGVANGARVISPAIAQRIKTPRNQAQFNAYYQDDWYGKVAEDYHDQWWSYAGVDAVVALGIHGQFIYVNSDYDVVIVKQSSDPGAENDRVDSETSQVMHAIAEHLGSLRH
ncbi:serine hydrolase domain-containing protein [Congregibacter sp.]|uniref:serine hydrolase domain-containing protein n=1 Tax=Congregibacter sp. TaxID=2744308 RepID=UPI003F6C05C3